MSKKPSQALATWESFQGELQQREAEISSMLPRNVSKQRFINSAISAVKQTPGLLRATPRSLFSAITKSAQDGLLPDGREGVITVYREKQKDSSYLEVAQWNPMTFGLRKRAREIDELIVNAQVVYANDHFLWEEGDDPKIEHHPAPLGQVRGDMIGAYAIFRKGSNILHREVMDAGQIETVKQQSKAPGGLLWTKFASEAWRKTVVRRGFKSVPCSEPLQTIVTRDDDMFAYDAEPTGHGGEPSKARVIQAEPDGESKPLPPVAGEEGSEAEDSKAEEPFYLIDRYGNQHPAELDAADFAEAVLQEIKECTVYAALGPLLADNSGDIERLDDDARNRIGDAYEQRCKDLRHETADAQAEA